MAEKTEYFFAELRGCNTIWTKSKRSEFGRMWHVYAFRTAEERRKFYLEHDGLDQCEVRNRDAGKISQDEREAAIEALIIAEADAEFDAKA